VRVVANASGTAEEYNHYYPLGGPIAQYSSSTSIQPVKFQGKEWGASKGLNLYDFGARRYDPATGRWISQDPLAEKYYAHSPYLFCAANPVKFVDPEGLIWDTPEEANALTERINNRIIELRVDNVLSSMLLALGGLADSESNRLKETIAYTEERIASLQKSINDISLLGSDPNNTYTLNSISGGYHYVHLAKNGNVLIDASSDAFAIHEITHVRQALQAGGLQFNNTGSLINPGEYYYSNRQNRFQNISNMEIEAYRIQHSFDESFYLPIKRLSEINVHSVGNIRDESNNFVYPYIHSLSDYLKRLESFSK
jgi:RHS repeat-associated protein